MFRITTLICLLAFLFRWSGQAQEREFFNKFESGFSSAYSANPEIPKGLLESVAYNRSRIRNLSEMEPASCTGLPQGLSLFGLVEDGKGYFSNTLYLVSDVSGVEVESLKSDPNAQIFAYATALSTTLVGGWSELEIAERLKHLSELPHESPAQQFALDLQTYEVLSKLNDRKFMNSLGYPTLDIDLRAVFGDNLDLFSSKKILMDGEHIYNESGETYRAGGGIAPCFNYAADAYVQTPTCNYSSRSGTPISAVTIHTIQGTYAGAISWAQNCTANVSYHYVVSNSGQITQMLCETDKGWHVGTANPYTIGIEHDGNVSDPNNYTPAMYATTADLVYNISQSGYGISSLRTAFFPWAATTNYNATSTPGSCVHIKGHQHFPAQSHTDPGQYWDWDYFYKLVNPNTAINTITTSTGDFYDSGGQIGTYINDERSLTLIQPTGASDVTVIFTEFDLEPEWDYLYIYDGVDVFSPLIGYYTGTDNPGTITSANGHLLFEFRSDCFTTNPGWEATWTSQGADNVPPTVEVTAGPWETQSFYAFYAENDNQGGSGVVDEERFSNVLDFDGTRWSGNPDQGYIYDGFNPGLNEWVSQTGTWNLSGASASQTDEANSNTNLHIPVIQEQFFNYLYSFNLKIDGSGANRRAGMHFMCSDATLENRGDSYFIYLRADNDKCQIYRVTNDVWVLQADVGLTVDIDTWYNVKVVCNHFNGDIRVYVDGIKSAEWTDPSPILTGNSISLRTGNCTAEYDDVRVYKGRIGAQYITVGATADPVRYQNPDPNTPACEIRTYVFDGAGNCSDEDSILVNIDWSPPLLSGINDGQGTDIDETNDGTQLFANWQTATDPNSGIDYYLAAMDTVAGGTSIYPFANEGLNTSLNVPYALEPYAWYYTTVKAVNAAGLESAPDTSDGQQYIPITVGIEEYMRQSIYPNPTTGIVNLPQIENLNWELMDVTARLIAKGSGDKQINLRSLGLTEQTYTLRLMTKEIQTSIKLVYFKR